MATWERSRELAGGVSSVGILDFREAISILAARLVNASPSLMALLQSDAGRAWKAELFGDNELPRQEKGSQLVEVEGLSDFEKLWCDFPKAWKPLVSSCQRKLVERRQRSVPARAALVPVPPTFGCDECDAVYFKLQTLRSHQMRAHQRRREARRYVLDSVCPVCSGAFWHGNLERSCRFRMTRWQPPTSRTARTVHASGKDEVIWQSRQCSEVEQKANEHVFGGRMLMGRSVSSQRLARVWMVFFSRTRRRGARWFFPRGSFLRVHSSLLHASAAVLPAVFEGCC